MQTTLVDGRTIARDIEEKLRTSYSRLKSNGTSLRLEVLSFGDNPATRSFLGIKKRVAERIGAELLIHELPENTLESAALKVLRVLVESNANGVVVQLPLPQHIQKEVILSAIPEELDIDCISPRSLELASQGKNFYDSPVVRALEEVMMRHDVNLKIKKVAVVGYGDLVGKPVSFYLEKNGIDYKVFDTDSNLAKLKSFDVVISGVGRPGLIKGDFIRDGVILFDAGTSEAEGRLLGDIDLSAHKKAALVTPVPGGVGPITVVKLFENLLLSLKYSRRDS
jgi:methylenetetrahydrofolate dehydrogenase (NADP+) / methenyltetrahydrofolate cyclohydrolase